MAFNIVPLALKLKRLIMLRLLVTALLLSAGIFFINIEKTVLYSIIFLVCLLSLFYALWLVSRKSLVLLGYTQIALDLILSTVLVHYTGGVDSIFTMLYILSIVSASFILMPQSGLIIAFCASGLYALLMIIEYFNWIPYFLPPVGREFRTPRDLVYILYMGYVRVTILCLVGFLSSYLSNIMNQMEEKIKIKEKFTMLGELTASLAHEIRNPLASISGSVEVLRENLKNAISSKDSKLMDAIIDEAHRLKNIFGRILDYARIEDLTIEPVPLQEIMEEVLNLAKQDIRYNKSIEIVEKYKSKNPRVFVDREKIKQVFYNVMLNAFQAMPESGMLTIDASETSRFTEITFQDTGCGMNSKQLKELFIPFKTTKPTGSGVGLAMSQRIMHSHEGEIKAKSRVGRGSTFTIRIPKL